MTFTPWWTRLPGRLLEEEQALLLLRAGEVPILRSHQWLREADGEPRIRAHLALGEASLEVEVRFPAHYPDGCPSVRPVPHTLRLSSHQFTQSGILCLELGPDNWHPLYTAGDLLRSAWKLFAYEVVNAVEPIEIPSRHVSDLASRVLMSNGGVLLRTRDLEARLATAIDNLEFEYVLLFRSIIRVCPVALPKGESLSDCPTAMNRETRHTGTLIRLRDGAPTPAPTDPQAFRDFVSEFGGTTLDPERPLVVLLCWPDGRTRGFSRLGEPVHELVDVPLAPDGAERTSKPLQESLAGFKVGIVGLGSLGSKVAVSLARSGARDFLLVDGDILLAPNICRHSADYRDVGALKVNAVRDLIRDVCDTEPRIARYGVNLGAATNPDLHADIVEALGRVDVLVDATADPDVFGILAMISSARGIPLAWAEVFGGGVGGLVASAHREQSPCPRCVRAGFLAAASAWPPAPSGGPSEPYAGGDAAPLVATDADVSLIAAALTNRVLGIVRGDAPATVVLIGLHAGWIFERPFHSIPVTVRADDWSCPRCWRPPAEPDPDTARLAEALFAPPPYADDPPSS